jgi:hypothetical protein
MRSGKWLPAVLLLGVVYLVVGVGFGSLAGRASSHQIRVAWRLAAWAVSIVAFSSHIAYEQIRRRTAPRQTAARAALAAALGSLGLAVAANVHALAVSGYRPLYALSLLIWPLATALPAFAVAWVGAIGLASLRHPE